MKLLGINFSPIRCAMHGGMDIKTRRWGYVCFKPPTRAFGRWWPAHFYLSPNATPWGATLLIGSEFCPYEKKLARLRRTLWGHGYDLNKHDPQAVESYVESFSGDLPVSDSSAALGGGEEEE